jgi:hypothetical protein
VKISLRAFNVRKSDILKQFTLLSKTLIFFKENSDVVSCNISKLEREKKIV